MKVIHKIKIHFDDKRGPTPSVDIMQGDAYTRELEFTLYSGSEAWNVPEGVSVAVVYHGASGQGAYDTLQDDTTKAYTVSGNVVTVTLIPQVAAVEGRTTVTVVFTDTSGKQLATFGVIIKVAANPGLGAGTPENYYNLREWLGAGPLYISVFPGGPGWVVEEDEHDIWQEFANGRTLVCCLETDDQELITLPFVKEHHGALYFSAVCDGMEWLVTLTQDSTDDSTAVSVNATRLPYEFRVTVIQNEDGSCITPAILSDIYLAYAYRNPVACYLTIAGSDSPIRLPLVSLTGGPAVFSGVYQGKTYTVTIAADGATVEVDVNAVSGVVLRDQSTGETYTLYMENAELHIVAGGKALAARDSILLADQASGGNYVIYVSGGELMIESEV